MIVIEILVGLLAIVGGLIGLYQFFKKCFMSSLKSELIPIQLDLDKIHEEIRTLSKNDCKNFLVKFLNDKDEGLPQNEECVKRAHEVKDRAKELGVNSYLASKWKVLMEEEW